MLTFTYPNLLWGLLALSVPIVLHLLNRRNHDTILFPVVKFLFRAQLPHEGRRRLRDFLLLLVRLLVLASAVLFLARPVWTPKREQIVQGGGSMAVFILDRSASMGGWNHLVREQQLLEKALAELPRTWRVAAVVSADGVLDELPATDDSGAVLSFAKQNSATHLAGNHRPALLRAIELLSEAQEAHLYLVSDFGRGDWGGLSKLVPPGVKLHFLSSTTEGERNVGIASVRTSLLPQGRRRVMVTLRNYSAQKEARTLTVGVGEGSVSQEVALAPFAQQRVGLSLVDAPSQAVGVASLTLDDYHDDDEFRFALKALSSPKALVIAEEDNEQRGNLSSMFTAKAMAAGEESGGTMFEVVVREPMLLELQECRDARAVFVLGCLDRLSPADLDMLRAMVSEGASLFVTPGLGGASVMLRRLRDAKLMTVQSNGMAEASKNAMLGVGWIQPESTIGQLCADWQEADLFLFPIFKHLRLQPEQPARTLMKSLAGLPLLIEQDCGAGKCHLFAFDFGTEWSAFALTSSFLPILRELCRSSVPEGFGVKRIICGSVLRSAEGKEVDTSTPGVVYLDDTPVEVVSPPQEAMTEHALVDDLKISLYAENITPAAENEDNTTIPLWKYAACFLVLFLLLEPLARR